MAGGEDESDQLAQYKLLAAARVFLERLMSTIGYSGLFDGTYAVSSRLKRQARLRDKILAKRKEGRSDYCLDHVTDIVGIRFISLYRRDITQTIKSVLQLIVGDTDTRPNALSGLRLVELKSYTSNSIPDQDSVNIELRSLYEREFAAKVGNVPLEMIARSRYSSVHMVLAADFTHEDQTYVIHVEAQFRSVFEDAWAEIDHKLLYELGRFNAPVDERQRETMAQHMGVLKKMVDTVADYADVIRRTISVSREKPVTIERNLDEAGYIRELAPLAKLPGPLADELALVLTEKVVLDEQIEDGRADISALQYVEIANKLRSLSPGIGAALESNTSKAARAILFSISMEEALCRLLSGDPQQIKSSVESYARLIKDYPEFPAGWFRSAQANQQLSDIGNPPGPAEIAAADLAFAQYSEARRRLSAVLRGRANERILLMSPGQSDYIGTNAARLQGFAKWRISDRRRRATGAATPEDFADVMLAYRVTKEALAVEKDPQDKLKLMNNAVFYAAEAHLLAPVRTSDEPFPEKDEMATMLQALTKDESDNIIRLDTIVKASLIIGNETAAAAAARRILDLNSDQGKSAGDTLSSPYVREVRERAVQNAWKVIRSFNDSR